MSRCITTAAAISPAETDVAKDPLMDSMKRLESQSISIAVLEDGSMRVVRTNWDITRATVDGATVYSAEDMYCYIQLQPYERRILHEFKRRFAATCDWRWL